MPSILHSTIQSFNHPSYNTFLQPSLLQYVPSITPSAKKSFTPPINNPSIFSYKIHSFNSPFYNSFSQSSRLQKKPSITPSTIYPFNNTFNPHVYNTFLQSFKYRRKVFVVYSAKPKISYDATNGFIILLSMAPCLNIERHHISNTTSPKSGLWNG